MTTVQVTSEINLDLDKVLDGVSKLETPELERFLSEVGTLLARRKAPHLPQREAELLQAINHGLPADLQQRYNELSAKLQAETITPPEHQELLGLIDQIEQTDAARMQHLIELAQLRHVSLDGLLN
jgi:hypothetical protein